MDAGEAIAREQIRDVISRYNHAGDRGDLEALVACFIENGVLDLVDTGELIGRDAIRRHLGSVVQRLAGRTQRALLRHHVSSVKIDLDGPHDARAASYFLVFTEIGLDHWGRYGDVFTQAGGQWRIARRKVRVDGAVPDSQMLAR